MNGEVGATGVRERAGSDVDTRPSRDALVRDGMQPWQWRSQENFAPRVTRAPRSQSCAGIRAFPAGWTSKISTVPPAVCLKGPVATTSELSAERIPPGAGAP